MKLSVNLWSRRGWLCLLSALSLFLNGCASTPPPVNPNKIDVAHLHVGDMVTVTYEGLPSTIIIQPHQESIKENGTITLQDIGSVAAAGKTLGELQTDIQTLYVPQYYKQLTITVTTTSERVYYVNGEVNHPGEQLYRDGMTVSKAITAAGDYTLYANHTKILLTRTSGQRIKLNGDKILAGEAEDPPVYPGDQVWVAHRYW